MSRSLCEKCGHGVDWHDRYGFCHHTNFSTSCACKSLIIERLPDWNYGVFLNETDASCIAIGLTEEEARENAERRLRADFEGKR